MNTTDPLRSAYAAALRLITYRPRTRKEMVTRLKRKFEPDVVNSTIALLTDQGYLNDTRFAGEWKARSESHNPKSAWLIQRELETRGIANSVALEAVQDMDDDENAYAAAAKATRRLANLESAVFKRRLWGHLIRRGFSKSVSLRTIERLSEERDENST